MSAVKRSFSSSPAYCVVFPAPACTNSKIKEIPLRTQRTFRGQIQTMCLKDAPHALRSAMEVQGGVSEEDEGGHSEAGKGRVHTLLDIHGWYMGGGRFMKPCIGDFLTLWVVLVHDCVLHVHGLHKVPLCDPFQSILWGARSMGNTACRGCAGRKCACAPWSRLSISSPLAA